MAQTTIELSEMILRRYFYYENGDIDFFTQNFVRIINREHTHLQLHATDEFRFIIWGNRDAQQKFTATFLDFFLLETLSKIMHFDRLELIHFENILLKYLKEVEPVEYAQEYERENHRNPFTPL